MFSDKYTTAEKVSKQSKEEIDLHIHDKKFIAEKDKIIISNDAFAQCEMQELLINTMRNK